MGTTTNAEDKKRHPDRDPGRSEPRVPEVDPAELEDDQADSGPDRDHKQPGS